jgi:hypothetical protein
VGAAGATTALAPGALMSGASGVPGFSLTIRKRTTSSAIRRVRSRPFSSSGVPAWNCSRWYFAVALWAIG